MGGSSPAGKDFQRKFDHSSIAFTAISVLYSDPVTLSLGQEADIIVDGHVISSSTDTLKATLQASRDGSNWVNIGTNFSRRFDTNQAVSWQGCLFLNGQNNHFLVGGLVYSFLGNVDADTVYADLGGHTGNIHLRFKLEQTGAFTRTVNTKLAAYVLEG